MSHLFHSSLTLSSRNRRKNNTDEANCLFASREPLLSANFFSHIPIVRTDKELREIVKKPTEFNRKFVDTIGVKLW